MKNKKQEEVEKEDLIESVQINEKEVEKEVYSEEREKIIRYHL